MLRQHLLGLLIFAVPALAQAPLVLKDGDTVAFVGNTFVEREQRDGMLELALTLAARDVDVTYRNLGWSGDTVDGRARRFFGPTSDGFQHLLEHIDLVKPTVILVSYGTSEAFDGAAGRESFVAGYERLLDALAARAKRIVLVSAPPLDPVRSPAPLLARQVNAELRWQAERLRALAHARGLVFVDLVTPLTELLAAGRAPGALTDNGVHLTPLGYRLVARLVLAQVGLEQGAWDADLASAAAALPAAQERLRQAICAKNATFFHRHRPQNETYLRGFRRGEQGNNAAEIRAFEPLARAQDEALFALRRAAIQEEARR